MNTTATTTDQSVPFPVDSATRPCCGGIGGHTQSCPVPNIVPPADAEAMCDWADWDNEFRFVYQQSPRRRDEFSSLSPCAAQLPDGSIDTDATVTTDPPHMDIDETRSTAVCTNA